MSESAVKEAVVLPGGGFLLAPVPVSGVFTREQFAEDSLLIAEEFRRFYQEEILPQTTALDEKTYVEVDGKKMPLAIKFLKALGEMGVLSAEIPEEYEGLGLDVRTGCLLSEYTGGNSGFAVTMGAHAGIGTLPIVYFGNEEQKARYLPALSKAEIVSCYALTEPNAGSDALSGRTTARLSEDGTHYILNGEKTFISNGRWADLAVVFARVDGLYSGFIVDLHGQGVSRGEEEKKMGQLGSSTCSLIFEDAPVPKENLLGEPGDASKIALNILNLGRLKLGFGCLGSMKYAINKALTYSLARKQFGQAIATFDMQKSRIAQMVSRTYATDAICYRIAGEIDMEVAESKGEDKQAAKVKVVRKHALEASIAKIYGSEALNFVAQHAVFMHGGYGYLTEYEVERVYRDNIVDMIYEGTNDVNRMVIFDDLVRNLFGHQIPYRESVSALDAALRNDSIEITGWDHMPEGLRCAAKRLQAAKAATLYALNHCLIHCGKNVRNEQQVMREMSDAMVQLYAMDSTLARVAQRLSASGGKGCEAEVAIATLVVHDGTKAVHDHTNDALLAAIKGEGERSSKLATLARLHAAMASHVAIAEVRRKVAETVIDAGKYCF